MTEELETSKPRNHERPRAVFSQNDFELIRIAVAHYLQVVKERPEAAKFASLYHRLGRIG